MFFLHPSYEKQQQYGTWMTRVGATNDISSEDTNSVDSALINSLDHFENVDGKKKGQNTNL